MLKREVAALRRQQVHKGQRQRLATAAQESCTNPAMAGTALICVVVLLCTVNVQGSGKKTGEMHSFQALAFALHTVKLQLLMESMMDDLFLMVWALACKLSSARAE
jgi:hypothetical protein